VKLENIVFFFLVQYKEIIAMLISLQNYLYICISIVKTTISFSGSLFEILYKSNSFQ